MNESNGRPVKDLGDRAWIRNAIEAHESALLRYAQHFLRDPDRGRDVVQDTFLQLAVSPSRNWKTTSSRSCAVGCSESVETGQLIFVARRIG